MARIENKAMTSPDCEATPTGGSVGLDDLKVILVGYDSQTSPGAVELPDAVDVFNNPFGSVIRSVFTLEVVDPDSVSNLYFHNSLRL